jgi:cell division protein FtsL
VGRRRKRSAKAVSRSKFRRKPVCVFGALVFVIVGASLGRVWQEVKLISMGYELRRLSLQESELAKSNARYKVEVAKLEAPDRLEAIARKQLGMVRPKSWQLVSIRMENPVPPPKPDEEPPLPETRESAEGFSFMAKLLD